MFQRCIVMRRFYVSSIQVKMIYLLLRAYAVFCGRFIITLNLDYLFAKQQGKLASFCLQRLPSFFETTIAYHMKRDDVCSNMVANILPIDPLPTDLVIFSEHVNVAY